MINIAQENDEPVEYSTKFQVFMNDKQTKKVHQENRILHFWFYNLQEHQYVNEINEFMKLLFRTDQFPRGEKD